MTMMRCTWIVVFLFVAMMGQLAQAALQGQYLFEGNLQDTSGLGRNGTANGTPTFTTGIYKNSTNAVSLDGSSSVLLPANTDFIRNAPGATLLAWVRMDSNTGARTIISINNGIPTEGSSRATLQIISATGNTAQIRTGGRIADGGNFTTTNSGTTAVPVGETVLLAGVLDYAGNSIRAYMNGVEVGANLSPGWTTNSADTANLFAEIGSVATPSAGTQEYWTGLIDGARIYNHALTASEIFNIYAAEALSPLLPGDTNGNGIPGEPADLTPIRTHWRQTVTTRLDGDLTEDNFVDFRDYRQWKTAFLNSGTGSLGDLDLSFLTAVPEPSAAALLVIGWLVGGSCRGLRKRSFVRN